MTLTVEDERALHRLAAEHGVEPAELLHRLIAGETLRRARAKLEADIDADLSDEEEEALYEARDPEGYAEYRDGRTIPHAEVKRRLREHLERTVGPRPEE